MTDYRSWLPQLGSDLFLTDGGLETTLIFHEGLELPHFAAFHLLKAPEGRAVLRKSDSAELREGRCRSGA
jgi:homocysteine S-methyltransferase